MMIDFVFHHKPIAKKRARFSKYKVYDLQSNEKKQIGYDLINQMRVKHILSPLNGPIDVVMGFYTTIPNKTPQKLLKSICGKPDVRKPDIDNYIKMYLDIMNKIIFYDDKQVVSIQAFKCYSNKPRVEIKLKKWDDYGQ